MIVLTKEEYDALKISDPTLYARNQLRSKLRKVLDEYKDELELHPSLSHFTIALSKVLEEETAEEKKLSTLPKHGLSR